ncbi:hypothetical protein MFLAVUS_004841, partial [Mucor flavus]
VGINLTKTESHFNDVFGGFRSGIENQFSVLGSKFKRFNNNTNATKIDNIKFYNLQFKVACLLKNINKFVENEMELKEKTERLKLIQDSLLNSMEDLQISEPIIEDSDNEINNNTRLNNINSLSSEDDIPRENNKNKKKRKTRVKYINGLTPYGGLVVLKGILCPIQEIVFTGSLPETDEFSVESAPVESAPVESAPVVRLIRRRANN